MCADTSSVRQVAAEATDIYNPPMRIAWSLIGRTALAVAAMCFLTRTALAQEPTISEMRISGQSRYGADQVIAAIRLKPGDAFRVKDLNRAAERLGKSGVFEEVSYTYTPRGGQMMVEFKVREVTRFRKCLFDNFVWASDDELQARLEREIPLYLGEAPESGEILTKCRGCWRSSEREAVPFIRSGACSNRVSETRNGNTCSRRLG
jgi:outer membrane protein assembly factor BamA